MFRSVCVVLAGCSMSSSGPLNNHSRARLKACTPHIALIVALTKTLVALNSCQCRAHQISDHLSDHKSGGLWALTPLSKPAIAANRGSTWMEAIRGALTSKTAVERESCVILETWCQHRETRSHLGSQIGAPLSEHECGSFSENSGTAQVRHCHSVKTSSSVGSKSCLLLQGTNTSWESLPLSPTVCAV